MKVVLQCLIPPHSIFLLALYAAGTVRLHALEITFASALATYLLGHYAVAALLEHIPLRIQFQLGHIVGVEDGTLLLLGFQLLVETQGLAEGGTLHILKLLFLHFDGTV